MNDIDDYSKDEGDFNDFHSIYYYYLYLDLFTDPGDTQDLLVTTSAWTYFDMVQNDNEMKLKNEQDLGSIEERNATTNLKKNNDDLNTFLKFELGESLPSLPFHSFFLLILTQIMIKIGP